MVTTYIVTMSQSTVRSIQNTYFAAISPFIKSGSIIDENIKSFRRELQSSKQLENRLVSVEAEFGILQATQARYIQIEKENKRLRKALGFKERSRFRLIPSKVLKRTPSSWWETLTIDKGEANGIATQYPIITEKGLVGKIDRVSENISTVLLITDESCQVSARVDDTPEFGIISGRRGVYGEDVLLNLKYLTNDISVKPGTRVYTSGKGGVFPDNIEIGTIVSVKKGHLYAEALVKPSIALDDTDVVFAISKEE